MTRKSFSSGFTMVEILIVMVIIGILATVGLGSYSNVQKRARDTRAIGDLKKIQNGFEQYYLGNNTYSTCNSTTDMASSTYFPGGLPTPAKGGTYTPGCSASGYCVCFVPEVSGKNSTAPTGSSCNFVSTGGTHYCVGNLQ